MQGGALTVTSCTFSGNSAPTGTGGAIYNVGTLTLTNSILSSDGVGGECMGTGTGCPTVNGNGNIIDPTGLTTNLARWAIRAARLRP